MMKEAENHLKMGSSILIFPEGTRSSDGTVKRFKDGAFVLAQKSGYPILPVVLNGTREAFSKDSIHIKGKQTFTLKVLPEISPINFMNKTASQLTAEIQQIITNEHKRIAPNFYQE
jgi:1-acyl-sn-glycerol-3-phosphate acyltransferase